MASENRSQATVGPQLYPRINRAALDQQAEALARSSSTREAEREFSLTHPLLLHRYARLRPALNSEPAAVAALPQPG